MNTFKNPLYPGQSFPDPFIVYHEGYYYGMKTEPFGLILYRSRSVKTLFSDESKNVLTVSDDTPVHGCVWAPELHYNPETERWYIYSSGSTVGWDFFTIRLFCYESATSDPWSDYTFKAFTDPNLLAIDATVFYDEGSETLYTALSEFTKEKGQVITFAKMDNPWTIGKERIQISYPKYDWEQWGARPDKDCRVNEGPIFLKKNGKLCLIYSASGCWSEFYRLGLVEYTGKDFSPENMLDINNWNKHPDFIFAEANDVYGVGHCSFFNSPDGTETWIAYHGMNVPDGGEGNRFMYLQKIGFDENNIPILGEPLSRDTNIPFPSGDPNA